MRHEASRRVPLRDRDDLSIYWDNHLRVAFAESAPHDIPAMVEASLAHVLMLGEQGVLPAERTARLLGGLHRLWERFGPGADRSDWRPTDVAYEFDGSVEDPYYFLEQQLAAACDISTADLDVQLARSRNDLDAGVFRMILRRGILDTADLLLQTAADLTERADATTDAVIIGHTHRRPAQPTTIAHVLSGLTETLLSQARDLLGVYDEMNVSPLGSAAFAGTDIPIDAARVGELLGFAREFTASYEAVAGAEHFLRLAAVHARITATGARWARVAQEWMGLGWIRTPLEFTQGSSIMPQKVNPVVLEHMVSMAGATNGDLVSTYTTIAAGWYEDSNNATTDVQKHLWASTARINRFLRLYDGLVLALEPHRLPSTEEIVESGATTTAIAEALATAGVPWRAAHDVVGTLVRAGSPLTWSSEQAARALADAGIDDPVGTLARTVLTSGTRPERVLERTQAGSPGRAAVRTALGCARQEIDRLREAFGERRRRIDDARELLLDLTRDVARQGAVTSTGTLSAIGNTNLDVITHGVATLPEPGTEQIVPEIEIRLGGSAANTAIRAAQLGVRTTLVSRVGDDPATVVLESMTDHPRLRTHFVTDRTAISGLTVAVEAIGRDRSFISSLGAMAELAAADVPSAALAADVVLFSGYFLLPGLQGEQLAELLQEVRRRGGRTALDTGHPDGGWNEATRRTLLRTVLPHVDYFLPNESELAGVTGIAEPADAAGRLVGETGATIVAKLGADGALVADPDGVVRVPAPPTTPVDTIGAGDAFNAAFLTGVLRGRDLPDAVRDAVGLASALVGALPEDREGLLRVYEGGDRERNHAPGVD